MPAADDSPRRGPLDHPAAHPLVLTGLVVVGAVLRARLAAQDLFADELATWWIVRDGGVGDVVDTVASTAEISPPLGFILSWISVHLGDSPTLVRLPALLGGIVSIPLAHAVALRTVGPRAALVATALVTVSPFMAYYSAEGRGYGVLVAFVLLSTLALLRAVDGGGWAWWVVHALATALAAYTHYTGFFVLGAQVAWALVVHPPARRPAMLATAAAVAAYVPWLPSLRGDLDSPTTRLLSILSPVDRRSVFDALAQWGVGFPAANLGWTLPYDISGSSLQEHPGPPALVLLAVGVVLAVVGLWLGRRRDGSDGSNLLRAEVVLVVLLAVASPVGAAVQSAVGSNVFRTRSMAPSWPYLAMAVAALLAAARPAVLARVATVLVVGGVAVSGLVAQGPDYQRPDFGAVTRFADERDVGVVVNGATWTPGPLTSFDIDGSRPEAEVIRLTVPEQSDEPFWFGQDQIDPAAAARRAVAEAGDRPILLVAFVPPLPAVPAFVDALPDGYERTETKVFRGLFRMEAQVYERAPG